MDELAEGWNVAFIMNKVNLFYFTGTQQNGILVVPRDNEAVFFCPKKF